MLYLDTSLLVAALSTEPKVREVQSWLAEQDPALLAISNWVISEFSAALSVKLRTGQITPPFRAGMLAAFNELAEHSLQLWPVVQNHFHAAAKLADRYALGLRAGDALHLAISADHGATLCTLDRRLAEAGDALGVQTLLL
jgi:predicted nucleic acid-binding protein